MASTRHAHGSTAPRDAGSPGAAYRFDTFRTGLLLDDLRFRSSDPGPGDPAPDFALDLLDGGTITSRTLGPRPVLLVFGSRTCPVTESAAPSLRELHREFGSDARFVLVNTREAHPGEHIAQPQTFEKKRAHAESLRSHHGIHFEVAVDDVHGTVHRLFGPKPNSAYLIRPDGTISYRAHWANDARGLREAIIATLADPQFRGQSRAMVRPLMRAVGHLPGIVRAGGGKVERDVWRAAPPLAVLARLSALLPWMALDRRGPTVAVTLGIATAAIAVGVVTLS